MTAARKLDPAKPTSVDAAAADPLEHGEDWEAEIDRRIAEDSAGRGNTFSLEEVAAEIRAKYGWE